MAARYSIVVVALIAAGLALWALIGYFCADPKRVADRVTPVENRKAVPLDQTDAWIEQLLGGKNVRLMVQGVDGEADKEIGTIEGLGRLEGNDHVMALASLDRVVGKRLRELREHYERDPSRWQSEEQRLLDEAQRVFRSCEYEAYRDAFVKGRYVLLNDVNTAPPLPAGTLALNVGGISHNGVVVLMSVIVKESDYGLDQIRRQVIDAKHLWLAKVVRDFNGLPLEERDALLSRLARNDPEDREWREKVFPAGVTADFDRRLVYVSTSQR